MNPADEIEAETAPGTAYTGKVEIYVDAPTKVTMELEKEYPGPVRISLKTIEEGRRYEVQASTAADLKPGKYKQLVKLRTSFQEQDQLEITFTIVVGSKGK